MKNEKKIIELMGEIVKGQDHLIGEVSGIKKQISKLNNEAVKLNLSTSENSRAILKLSDEIRLVGEHEKRISKLESIIFK